MNGHPWTEGPWLYRAKSGSWHKASDTHPYGLPFITTPDACDMEFENPADAELIALAPEMAAAILECAGWMTELGPLSSSAGELTGILPMARRLRAVGGGS